MGARPLNRPLEGRSTEGITESAFKQPLYVPNRLRGASVFSTLTAFLLRDFARGPWLWLNLVGVLLTHLIFFGNAPNRAAFFAVTYITTLVLAALTTGSIFSRANHAHTYPILARRISKTTYVAAGMLASWLIGILAYGLAALLVLLRYGVFVPDGSTPPEWLNPGTLATGSLPVAVGVACVVALMTLVANFVSPFGVRLLVLGVIALGVMAFDPRSFPIENLRPFIQVTPPLLAPLVGALRFATDTHPDSVARASLLLVAGYTTTIIGLVWWLSSRREVVIE
jgi:hypothetical protein